MKTSEVKAPGRRDFLRKAAFGAGAVAVAGTSLSPGSAKAKTPATGMCKTGDRAADAGYRETAHVRRFYELARD